MREATQVSLPILGGVGSFVKLTANTTAKLMGYACRYYGSQRNTCSMTSDRTSSPISFCSSLRLWARIAPRLVKTSLNPTSLPSLVLLCENMSLKTSEFVASVLLWTRKPVCPQTRITLPSANQSSSLFTNVADLGL